MSINPPTRPRLVPSCCVATVNSGESVNLQIAGIVTLVTPLLAACGVASVVSDGQQGMDDAAQVCGSVMFLATIASEQNADPPTDAQLQQLQETIEELPVASARAAAANEKYAKLDVLVGQFVTSLDQAGPAALIELGGLERECAALGGQ